MLFRSRTDANKDGVIGSPFNLVSRVRSTALLSESFTNRLLVSIDGQSPVPLQWGGNSLISSDPRLTGWTAEAAAGVDGVNTLLWRHSSGLLATWTFDARWNALSGTLPVTTGSEAAITYESQFARDLNGDGIIGEPSSRLSALRYQIYSTMPSANAKDPFSSYLTGSDGPDLIASPDSGNNLLSGSDPMTGQPLASGSVDVLDGGLSAGRDTFFLSSFGGRPFAEDGDAGFVLVKNYDSQKDDLVIATDKNLTMAIRTLAVDGAGVTGVGLHLDSNQNGTYDPGDNLIALLDNVSTAPGRLIKIAAI